MDDEQSRHACTSSGAEGSDELAEPDRVREHLGQVDDDDPVRPGPQGLVGPLHVDPLAGPFLHPHPRAARTAAEAALSVPVHLYPLNPGDSVATRTAATGARRASGPSSSTPGSRASSFACADIATRPDPWAVAPRASDSSPVSGRSVVFM